jgi:hypothetical protein
VGAGGGIFGIGCKQPEVVPKQSQSVTQHGMAIKTVARLVERPESLLTVRIEFKDFATLLKQAGPIFDSSGRFLGAGHNRRVQQIFLARRVGKVFSLAAELQKQFDAAPAEMLSVTVSRTVIRTGR